MNKDFLNSLKHVIEKNIPFVVFRSPKESAKLIVDQNPILDIEIDSCLNTSGFIFHPFERSENKIVFFTDELVITNENANEAIHKLECFKQELNQQESTNEVEISEQKYLSELGTLIDELNASQLEKVVYSRIKKSEQNEIDLVELFCQLVNDNENAFVYLLNSEETGTWIGASPERFLSIKNGLGQTTALAGTKKKSENKNWTDKEFEEQQIVTDYISNALIKSGFENYDQSERYDFETGNLVHLKNDFTFKISEGNIASLIETLHPTPAVAGIPKQEAIQKILDTESHQRSYYTGFMGEIHSNGDLNLFVNLRCAKLENSAFNLFIGGGITKDSNPMDEWEETEAKSKALLASIEKLRNFD